MSDKLKYILLIGLVIFVGCRSNKNAIPRNLEMIYNPSSSTIRPELRVYNTSDTSSLIVIKLNAGDLLYNQANPENKLQARVEVSYNVYDLNEKDRLVDSSMQTFSFNKDIKQKSLRLEIPVSSQKGFDYILEVITTDLNRKSKQYSFLHLNRSSERNIQDFLFYNRISGGLFVSNHYQKDTVFSVKYYKQDTDSLNVFYFGQVYDVPAPPYENDAVHYNFSEPDTNWVIFVDSIDYELFKNKGVYYLTTENSPDNGYPLLNFGENFPWVKTPKELIEPLSYFGVSDSIYENDSTGRFTKLAVDNFWLDKANNTNKSRELLKLFYNRVMFANFYFTSFVEGWKTDRGMIYIIYGIPDYVFKSDEEEKWIYNPVDLGPGYSFSFKYDRNPFSINHFVLDREKLKSTGWNEAIKLWENGEVYYYQK